MTIREARPDEVGDVLALWRAAEALPSVTDTAEDVSRIVESDRAWLLVAEEDDRIAGTLIVGFDGWRGHLYRLAVLPDLRRRGIATALVRAGEARLRAAGARRLAAIVLADHAAEFWAAAGYERQSGAGRFTKTS